MRIAQSRAVYNAAAHTLTNLGIKTTPADLKSCLAIRPVKDTNIFTIEAFSTDPNCAKTIVDVVSKQVKIECRKQIGADIKTIDPPYALTSRRGIMP